MTTPLNEVGRDHTFEHMDQERQEVYERIPWETLEKNERRPSVVDHGDRRRRCDRCPGLLLHAEPGSRRFAHS